MTTRHITTSHEHDVCDLCGRTLLRGEHPEVFLDGPRRYSVCELCKQHALNEGWVREGTIPDFQGAGGSANRRRSLLGRFRARGGGAFTDEEVVEEADELEPGSARAGDRGRRAGGRGASGGAGRGVGRGTGRSRRGGNGRAPVDEEPPAPQTLDDELSLGQWPPAEPVGTSARGLIDNQPAPAPVPARSPGERGREPRRVHAVPTGDQQKITAALNAFNRTQYTRTVASVGRSLGVPGINVTPDPAHPTLVRIVATWELCWYRYEVDLSDDPGSVRLDGQGYELDELDDHELVVNAAADDDGRLYYE